MKNMANTRKSAIGRRMEVRPPASPVPIPETTNRPSSRNNLTSKTVAALLSDLEVTRSHSRPRVSNDNPYSESLFKTMKYGPEFPERFASLGDARAFISGFMDWYNHHHQHSGIGFHTPANVHYGLAGGVARKRSQTLAAARAKHPHRFGITADPKILAMPGPAWINQPNETTEKAAA